MIRRFPFILAVLIFAVFVAAGFSEAATVTLQWDPNPEADVAGYIVSYGTTSGQYTSTVDVGKQLSLQFTEPNPAAVYYFAVRAYNTAGLQSALSTEVNTTPLITDMTLTGLSASLPAPQPSGTTVTFAAGASGGIAPYQYKWRIYNGSTWSVAADWSAGSTFTWTPASANSNYRIGVWVRSATSTTDAPDNSSSQGDVPFPIVQLVQPLTLTNLYSSVASPQPVGTNITFTAQASGGTAPYQYKWSLTNGSGWTVLQNWSASSTFIWTPSAAGTAYKVGVWVRSAGSTVDAAENGAGSSVAYVVTALSVVTVNLTANKAAPERVGTRIQFTATAVAVGTLQYKWWIYDGASWVVLQEWSRGNRLFWTPTRPNPNYKVMVRAQLARDPSVNGGAAVPFPIGGKRR